RGDGHRDLKGRRRWARALAGRGSGGADGPRAQPVLGDEHACSGQQPHLEEVAAAEAGLDDVLSIEERAILRTLSGWIRTGLGKIRHECFSPWLRCTARIWRGAETSVGMPRNRRSEERRVGKGCRSRWWRSDE